MNRNRTQRQPSDALVLPFLTLLAALLLTPSTTLACRYSVRDTGFVDLGGDPYRLVLRLPPSAPATLRTEFEQAAAAVFLDANILFSAADAPNLAEPSLVLHAPDQRQLPIASVATLPSSRAEVVDLLEGVALSPFRIQLHEELLRTYAALVLVEGEDPDANRRARAVLEEAGAAVARLFPSMPKPIEVLPPRVLTLPLKAVETESVLLWGLGMHPKPTRDPRAAVVFGRGRRVGESLEGALITRTVIQDRLALIGQDCECDLDRGLLQGPVIPARWDAGRQKAAANSLGFDPENPLIRAEISRIVLKGPSKPGGKRTTTGAFDALALGYSEEPIELASTSTSTPTSEVPADPPEPVSPPAAPTPPPAASPARQPGSVLGLWAVFSGLSLSIATAGLWLLFRARKDP